MNSMNSPLVEANMRPKARAELIAEFCLEIEARPKKGPRVEEPTPKIIGLLDVELCRGLQQYGDMIST